MSNPMELLNWIVKYCVNTYTNRKWFCENCFLDIYIYIESDIHYSDGIYNIDSIESTFLHW